MGVGRLVGVAVELPGKLVSNGIIIGAFALAAAALILVRYAFMLFAPWGARHSNLIAAFVNLVMDVAWGIFEVIKVVVQVVINIIRAVLHKGSSGISVDDPPGPVSSTEVELFLNNIPVQCHAYTWSNYEMLRFPLRHLLSPTICPMLRYLWPTQGSAVPIYEWANAAVGWVSYDPVPMPGEGNCKAADDTQWLCVGLGTGYLLMEILIPAMIFVLIGLPIIIALVQEAYELLVDGVKLALAAESFLMRIVSRLGRMVESLISVN